jgi:hypothetical protein
VEEPWFSSRSRELLSKIEFKGLGMNVETGQPDQTGESFLDVFVDGQMSGDKRVVLIAQRVDIPGKGELVVGFLVIGVETENRWFLMNPGLLYENRDNSPAMPSVNQGHSSTISSGNPGEPGAQSGE